DSMNKRGVSLLNRIFLSFFFWILILTILLFTATVTFYLFIPNVLTFWLLTMIVSLILISLFSYGLSRMIRKPVIEMRDVTALITDSIDLSTYVSYRLKNELGLLSHGINRLIKGLKGILLNVKKYAESFMDESEKIESQSQLLATSSAELATGVEKLSNGIVEQANRAAN